jgi:hypothetical protein
VAWSPDGTKLGFTYVGDDGIRTLGLVNRDGAGFRSFGAAADGVTAWAWTTPNRLVVVSARNPIATDPQSYDLLREVDENFTVLQLLSASLGRAAGLEVRAGSGDLVYLNEYGLGVTNPAKGVYRMFKIGDGGAADVSRRKLSLSPDGAWAAVIVDGTRMVVDVETGAAVPLGQAAADDMVGPWSADGSVVGYLGRSDGAPSRMVTAYHPNGQVAWTRPEVTGEAGFLAAGWAGTVLCPPAG